MEADDLGCLLGRGPPKDDARIATYGSEYLTIGLRHPTFRSPVARHSVRSPVPPLPTSHDGRSRPPSLVLGWSTYRARGLPPSEAH